MVDNGGEIFTQCVFFGTKRAEEKNKKPSGEIPCVSTEQNQSEGMGGSITGGSG